eukprot:4113730-Prymnesium_polylepis.1
MAPLAAVSGAAVEAVVAVLRCCGVAAARRCGGAVVQRPCTPLGARTCPRAHAWSSAWKWPWCGVMSRSSMRESRF